MTDIDLDDLRERALKATRAGTSTDPSVLMTIRMKPEWLQKKVLARLSGYPDPGRCWCWPWGNPYGKVAIPAEFGGRLASVHRVVWLALRGEIPEGLVLDHDDANGCKNRACANPDHLVVTTQRGNTLSGTSPVVDQVRRTHCPEGHPLVEGNLIRANAARGGRACLTCDRARSARNAEVIRTAQRLLGMTWEGYVAKHGKSRKVAESIIAGRTLDGTEEVSGDE